MKKVLKILNVYYYGAMLCAVLVAVASYFLVAKYAFHIDAMQGIGRNISYVVMLYVIVSVPLSLWGYNYAIKRWKNIENEEEKMRKYLLIGKLRIVMIGIGLLAGISFFYILQERSMIFCAGIAAVGLYFCKPTQAKMVVELENETDKE